jgi:hypothetical protein
MTHKDLSERMQSVAARGRQVPDHQGDAAPVPVPVSVPVPVPTPAPLPTPALTHRVTVDLDDGTYDVLRGSAYEWRTPASAILRSLLRQLASDPDLSARVRAETKKSTP